MKSSGEYRKAVLSKRAPFLNKVPEEIEGAFASNDNYESLRSKRKMQMKALNEPNL